MVRAVKKYNPAFLSEQELVDSFCVRSAEFGLLVQTIRESTDASNTHAIVIGPRGSGKTTLLLRAAAEVRRDSALSAAWLPVVFPEESYEVSTYGELWLQCLLHMADQAPSDEDGAGLRGAYEDLCTVRDERFLGELCLRAILEFAGRMGKRLALFVENLNGLFGDLRDPDVGWQLRKVLQCEPRILLIGSATSRFDEIDNPERALYDLFQIHPLNRLDTQSCARLWQKVSGRDVGAREIRPLEILTGGNPRLLVMLAEFGSRLSLRDLLSHMRNLVDRHTEYFRSHLEALGAQERRVYLALATLWKPATAKEVSELARQSSSVCSAQLKRLVRRGAVVYSGGTPRRREYYVAERMYNIYYLLRRGRGADQVVEALVGFMASFYSEKELRGIAEGIATEVRSADGATRAMLEHAIRLLSGTAMPAGGAAAPESVDRSEAGDLIDHAEQLLREGKHREAIALCDKVSVLLTDSDSGAWHLARALCAKSLGLAGTGRINEAIEACEEVLSRYGESNSRVLSAVIARTMANKIAWLGAEGRKEELISAAKAFVQRFDSDDPPATARQRAAVLLNQGGALLDLGQRREASDCFDEVIERYAAIGDPDVQEPVAMALAVRARLLDEDGHEERALAEYSAIVQRFGGSRLPYVMDAVDESLLAKGGILKSRGQFADALAVAREAADRFDSADTPAAASHRFVAHLFCGTVLGILGRHGAAEESYDAVLNRFSRQEGSDSDLDLSLAKTYVNRSVSLVRDGRLVEASETFEAFVEQFGGCSAPLVIHLLGHALLELSKAELRAGDPEAAIATAGRVLKDHSSGPVDYLVLARLVRAEGCFAGNKEIACESELKAMLALLPGCEIALPIIIKGLIGFAHRFGPKRILSLIEESPATIRLYPLVVALREELGIKTRVAREITEVVKDIRPLLAGAKDSGAP